MSAVVTNRKAFEAMRELRNYASSHHLPKNTLLRGCEVAKKEIENGRGIVVAVHEGQKAMRSATPHHQGAVA